VNLGLHACMTNALALEPHPFCSGYFGDGDLSNYFLGLLLNCDPPDLSIPGS
jgi:hypothetical protein